MWKPFLFLFVLAVVLSSERPVKAEPIVIDNLPATGSIGSLGELTSFLDGVASYYAQSFVAPTEGQVIAGELTFLLASAGQAPGPMDFRVLLTETTGGTELTTPTDIRPTHVLFESST